MTGEHSVVYGEPALLASLGLRCRAKIKKIDKPRFELFSDKLGRRREESLEAVKIFWQKAKEAWEDFDKYGKKKKLEEIRKDRYVAVLSACGLCLEETKDFKGGVEIELRSELPVGSGLGSSACVATAVVGGMGRLLGKKWSLEELNRKVYQVEKIMHGKPSGGDPTIVIFGGILQFQKLKERFKFKKLFVGKGVIPKLFLIDSGRPLESTGEMVEKVSAKCKVQSAKCQLLIKRIGSVSRLFIDDFKSGIISADLIRENERYLEELGVVGKKAMAMICLIEAAGGVAKISGGGGLRGGSGVIIAYHHDADKLEYLINKQKWQSFTTSLGGEGWRVE